MAFWTNYNTDPKRSFRYRFILSSDTAAGQIREYTIKEVKKPSFQMEAGPQAKYIQHTFKYPGRVSWQDVTFSIVDPGANDEDASVALMNVLAKSGYQKPTTQDLSRTSISKRKANTSIGIPRILEIDAEGRDTTTWSLHNAYITGVDFGQLSYETDEMVTYQITLSYDYATIKKRTAGGVLVDERIRSDG
tara:strand:+ start:555 stop:1127 length:573 start_codon:yes stop_codon:yes gene_type:complete